MDEDGRIGFVNVNVATEEPLMATVLEKVLVKAVVVLKSNAQNKSYLNMVDLEVEFITFGLT